MVVVAISLLIGGLLVASVGRRMASDGLEPNGLAGLRTKATFRSDEAWYAGQRAAAPWTIASAVAMFFSGGALLPTGMEPTPVSIGIFVATLLLLALFMAMSVVAGQRAAREA